MIEINDCCEKIKNVAQLSPLNLAFVGDAVYSLLVRTRLVAACNQSSHEHNKQANAVVCAVSQSKNYYKLLPILSDNELSIIKRGRNANPSQKAKNASFAEYRNATGLEALFGYLYLNGEKSRLIELFNICWSVEDEK
ncbi:MAG: ribonuclease III [Defluviitaleaceae bacterium]|nr:ribonuclease III [Defluviitaleaceae bacterium]